MSSALVRQALEFVDPEERSVRKRRRATRHDKRESNPYKTRNKKRTETTPSERTVEDNVKKLLALSTPTTDSTVAEKIVQRAVKGKPLLEKVEVKKEEEKSILFPEEPYSKFEREYFCS